MHRTRDAAWIMALLLLPLLFFVANSKASRDYAWFDRALVWVSYPVQWSVVTTVDAVSHTWGQYIDLVGVRAENDSLRAQVNRMTVQVHHLQEAARENERLRQLLGAQDDAGLRAEGRRTLYAQVVATAPSPLFRSLRINRGSNDGIVLGAAVLHGAGVVGRVAALSAVTADVMLLTDANSSADVLVQRSRARVRVRGRGGDGTFFMDAQYLERTADVEPGDVLMTSGLGATFPKGLIVGRILAVERRAFGLYQRAEVIPTVDFSRLEEVLVLLPAGA